MPPRLSSKSFSCGGGWFQLCFVKIVKVVGLGHESVVLLRMWWYLVVQHATRKMASLTHRLTIHAPPRQIGSLLVRLGGACAAVCLAWRILTVVTESYLLACPAKASAAAAGGFNFFCWEIGEVVGLGHESVVDYRM